MAIGYARCEIIKAEAGGSAVSKIAYIQGRRARCQMTGQTIDFSNKAGILASGLSLPEGIEDAWNGDAIAWAQELQRAELVYDRRQKTWRYRDLPERVKTSNGPFRQGLATRLQTWQQDRPGATKVQTPAPGRLDATRSQSAPCVRGPARQDFRPVGRPIQARDEERLLELERSVAAA